MKTQPDEIILRLESTNSRLEKESIIRLALEEDLKYFFHGLRLALDSLCTFGVKKVPIRDSSPGQGLPWDSFVKLTDQLGQRSLTGNAAQDAIKLMMDMATESQWNNWYRRILIKDLKCGVSVKTVNKVCKQAKRLDLSVPVFSSQLAQDSEKHLSKMKGPKQVELKLDGVRCLIVVNKNKVECFSRNGVKFMNFTHIEDQILFSLKEHPVESPYVLDGEMMSDSFQMLMKQVYRKRDVSALDSVFNVFDMIDLQSFERGYDNTPQNVRSMKLREWYELHKNNLPNINCLDYENVNLDTEIGKKRLDELRLIAANRGFEGLIVKDPDAKYESKRTSSWLKIKPFISLDLHVVGINEGTGKNVGRMGALVCKGFYDDKEIFTNVGTGFSEKQRQDIWDNISNVVGQVVELNADTVTQNQDGTYSLRFPRFNRFRGFVPGEKI